MADTIWKSRYKGVDYEVTTRDLTVSRLRQMKQWFGAEYGKYTPFITLLVEGDVDALACVVWIAQSKAGEKPQEPRNLDFSIEDFEKFEEDVVEPDPEPDVAADPPPDGTTPTTG